MDRASVDELLTTTRSVRKRLDFDRPVEPEVIEECLDLALQAPTGSNSQGWRFIVVTDQDKKDKLAEWYREVGTPYLGQGAEGLANLGEKADAAQMARVVDSAKYLLDNIERAPVMVIPCIIGRPPDGAPPEFAAGMMGSIFPAVWSFQLALRSRGLGSCLTSFHLFKAADAAALLGIPDGITQVALLPVAYTKGTDFKPAKRRPATEVTYWNAWKQTRS